MITNASSPTLSNLRQTFGLRLNSSDRFFDEWLNNAATLTEAELQGLDCLTRNYTYLSQIALYPSNLRAIPAERNAYALYPFKL